jgi:hypothetical protein
MIAFFHTLTGPLPLVQTMTRNYQAFPSESETPSMDDDTSTGLDAARVVQKNLRELVSFHSMTKPFTSDSLTRLELDRTIVVPSRVSSMGLMCINSRRKAKQRRVEFAL